MADGFTLDYDFDITKAEAKQRKLQREFDQALDKLKLIKQQIAQTTAEIEKSKQAQADYNRVIDETANKLEAAKNGNISLSSGQISALERQNAVALAGLQKQEAVQKRLGETLQNQTLQFKKQDRAAANVADKIKISSASTGQFSKKLQNAGKSMQRLGKRISSLIASALFFSVITKAFTALRKQFSQLLNKEGSRTAELIAEIKGNLSTIGMTLYESARPYIEWLLQKLAVFTDLLSNGIAKLLGKNVNQMKKLAKQTKKTGEEAKKATASFDTIQVADGGDAQGQSGGSSGNTKKQTGDTLADLYGMLIVGAALLVLGVILTFTNVNIPLGLALMAAGAVMIVAPLAANWEKLPADVKQTIAIIGAAVSVALLVIGAILAFTGHLPIGIALIAAGAVGLAAAAPVVWNSLSDKVKNIVAIIAAVVSVALLVLGAILAFTGVGIPLGIALMVAGAAGLAAVKALMWNSISDKTKSVIQTILAILGGALVVLGIVLLFTGVGIGLGIGLILAGAASLAAAVAVNPDGFLSKVKKFVGAIGGFFDGLWEGLKSGFKAAVTFIVGLANKWIDGLNFLLTPLRGLIYGIAKVFGSEVTFDEIAIPHIPVPKLATGAVLPGGSPMLAMVNDQPKGKPYLEGSVENIAAAFDKYLGNRNFAGTQNINIKATGSMAQLIRYLKLAIDDEDTRVHA